MTPKEKAKYLIQKFAPYADQGEFLIGSDDNVSCAKQCALIAVEEILKGIVPKDDDYRLAYELGGNQFYWKDVKSEIEKL